MRKIQHAEMKEMNYELVLRSILHGGTVGRVDLVRETDLSASTVSRCVAKLVQSGIIVEAGITERSKLGRKAINLRVNSDILNVLLVDIGAERVNFALGRADGTIQKLKSCETPEVFDRILDEVRRVVKVLRRVDVVAFSVPGMVDVENKTIMFVPSTGWRDIKVRIEGVEVFVDNEANLAIIAEAFHRSEIRNSQCSVFVTVREGFGTGIWINGKIYRGPSFTAGEFGHTVIDLRSEERCHCGNKGCVENFTSVLKLFPEMGSSYPQKINELILKNDVKLVDYVEILSTALANIVNALNPEYLIIGGELVGLESSFYQRLEEMVKLKSLHHAAMILKVVPSTFTTDTYLYGALYAVFEEYLIPKVLQLIS